MRVSLFATSLTQMLPILGSSSPVLGNMKSSVLADDLLAESLLQEC